MVIQLKNPDASFIVSPSDMEMSWLCTNSIALSGARKGRLTVPASSLIAASLLIAVSLRCVQCHCDVSGLLGRGRKRCGAKKRRWEFRKWGEIGSESEEGQSVFILKKKKKKRGEKAPVSRTEKKSPVPMPPLGSFSIAIHLAAFFSMFNDGRTNQ